MGCGNAGRGGWHTLAASVPECQESLSILLVRCGCGRSRHLVRCLPAAKDAAWLRPWFLCRMPKDSNHSSKAAASVCHPPSPGCLSHVPQKNITSFQQYTLHLYSVFSCNICKKQPEEWERGWLPVTLEKCLGALSILHKSQGRSQAPPIAYGGQPEADKVARPSTATTSQQDA